MMGLFLFAAKATTMNAIDAARNGIFSRHTRMNAAFDQPLLPVDRHRRSGRISSTRRTNGRLTATALDNRASRKRTNVGASQPRRRGGVDSGNRPMYVMMAI